MTDKDTDKQVRRVIIIEGAANVVVLGLKAFVGVSTGSLAILADALHSLTDVFNNIVAWIVVRISSQPPDRKHPYGHRKFEGLAVFILATLLAVLSIEIATRALTRGDVQTSMSTSALVLMGVVLLVNVLLSSWERHWARKLNSDILLADASHTFADVLTTLVVIAGWQLSLHGYPWLDTLCALGVAGLVMYLAYSLFRRVVPILVDEIAVEPERVINRLLEMPGIYRVRRVRTRRIGATSSGDVIVSVDPSLSIDESHDIADRIERVMHEEFDIQDVVVHVEPEEA